MPSMPLWTDVEKGLRLREDDWSWQGASSTDPLVFLRRLKDRPHEVTDLSLGQLGEVEAGALVGSFLGLTGGVASERLVLRKLGGRDDPHTVTVAAFDRAVSVLRHALLENGRTVSNTFLNPDGDAWNGVLVLASVRRQGFWAS